MLRLVPQIASMRHRLRALTLLVVCAVLVVPATAGALERDPTYENGPRTPFNFLGGVEQDTADVPGLPPTASTGGLQILGDSIAIGVPYVQRAAADGVRAQVRAWAGWTVRLHRMVTGWDSTAGTSFDAAANSDAGAVFLALGTNDVGCLKPYGLCPETPEEDDPDYPAFLARERELVRQEVDSAASELIDSGKCVLWAGPRIGKNGYASDQAVTALDDQLRDIAAANPGRFTYVDYDAYSRSDPALSADFADPNSDGTHPRTAAGKAAVAELAVSAAEAHCPLTTEPRVAISPPLPPPDPPVVPPPPPPVAVDPPLAVPVPVPPQPQPRVQPKTGCAARTTAARRKSCRRALAVTSCRRFHTVAKRSSCMLRLRRLYGASSREKAAVKRCAKRPRARRAACRASAKRTYRFR